MTLKSVKDLFFSKRKVTLIKKGKGASGKIFKALVKDSEEIVALKKIYDVLSSNSESKILYRELFLLNKFKDHPNIMKIYDIYRGSNDRDVYIISEYIDENLHTVARSKILKEVHIKYIAYQLFKVMKYIHSSKIIHRDLKPSNILINKYSDIKLSDFALAKSVEDSSNYLLTDYMATRWYRAPEILLSAPLYNEAVDIWSIGCIIGELILGKPLFPGNCTLNQLDLIMQQIGKPTAEDIGKYSKFNYRVYK